MSHQSPVRFEKTRELKLKNLRRNPLRDGRPPLKKTSKNHKTIKQILTPMMSGFEIQIIQP